MQIYAMSADGSGQYRLTYSGANDVCPRWSPDGSKILFESDRDNPTTGYMDIYVMNADGSGVARLTTDPNDDSWASWSSDGSHIVFHSKRNGTNYQVYSMNANGSNQINLSNSAFSDGDPSYSPDGSKIAFASDRDHPGYDSVYVMNSTGTNQHRITFSADNVSDNEPVWSRDGTRIAFVSTRDSSTETWQETDDNGSVITKSRTYTNKEIYLMNGDGSAQTRLTNSTANDDFPNWSPDGSKIVFSSDRDRDSSDPIPQVWTMNSDGTGQADLLNSQAGDYSGSWASGSGNQPPIANAGGPYSGVVSQNVPFNGSNSFDPDGSIASYSWSFGDGGTGSGSSPTHAYTSAGTYTVTLTVADNLNVQGSTTTTVSVSSSSSDAFANNFLLNGLGRSPHGDESSYWTDIMRAAYSQGQTSMLMAMREFGMTVFESQEYINRGRTNHEYVYDLYRTYLMRDPDLDGWNFWTGQCDSWGREAVRQAFDNCAEFNGIVANLTASGSPSASVASLATAQVDPFNQSGNQVEARDCEWSLPLISLPGRAGLDLGLSVSYSSLVWTKSGPYIYFDQDYESLSPGFTIGFPTVQFRKFDAQTGRNVYVLTAGGRHTELRQVGTSNIYEGADSSYLQLIDNSGSLLLRTPDGTQMSFAPLLHGYSVAGIEDRNGNLITVDNDWRGDIQHITDTLNRTINFIYDSNANLIRIEQTWATESQPHVWATFGWDTKAVSGNFGSQVVGTSNGETMPVVAQIALDDGSRYNFEYNGTMQASFIRRYTFDPSINDYGQRTYTAYDYQGTSDCPRIFRSRVWAQSWNGDNGVPSEVVTQFLDPGDGSHVMIAPDGTTNYKEFYGSNWQNGLVTSSQILSGSTVEKTTTTSWTQDVTQGINYQINPRVVETDISDGTNHRKTTIGYQSFNFPAPSGASCSLPNEVREYDADQTTVLRRSFTHYITDSAYLTNRIIGLVDISSVYQGESNVVSKTTYCYDCDTNMIAATATTPVQHDSYFDSTDLSLIKRGDLMVAARWDVTDPNNGDKQLFRHFKYDTAGNVISTFDAINHHTDISYGDAFSVDGANLDVPRSFTTLAYPTTVTDPDGFASTLWYRYDIGAKSRAQGPPPQNQPNGIIQTFLYDGAARLQRMTTTNNGAYTRYFYGPYYVQSWAAVNNIADEAYSIQTFDGVGRPLGKAANHPGSLGGYSAQLTKYDLMGRALKQSNPTEIDGGWNPTGDDLYNAQTDTGGFRYTQQSYDWKGRPRVTTHPDGSYQEANYEGCGCAGGEAVTLTDEGTIVNGQTLVRTEKTYSDTFGRQWKSEVLNWDGSVYAATVNVFNARDQVTRVFQYAGPAANDASSSNEDASCPSGTCQKTTMSYEGYGRLQSKHVPEQQVDPNNSSSTDHTTWNYNADDTVDWVKDARGAKATYEYNNNRHLVTHISYDPASGGDDTPDVWFAYDAAGNRTLMTDGLGTQSYSYNSLSQLMSETRSFNAVGSFTLSYDYNLAGELKKITDPTNMTISYNYDSVGRLSDDPTTGLTAVTSSGALYAGVIDYASNFRYRAWGAIKHVNYGNGRTLDMQFNSRLQPTRYEVPGVIALEYQYTSANSPNNDGRIKFARDLTQTNSKFDRGYSYDHLGRLSTASSGSEARGGAIPDGPYGQTYFFDAFNNSTGRTNRLWSDEFDDAMTINPATNRNADWTYDADGHVIHENVRSFTFDAAGRMVTMIDQVHRLHGTFNRNQQRAYDGDGLWVRQSMNNAMTYEIRSSILKGAVIMEVNATGQKQTGNVYAGGALLAKQANNEVSWQHEDMLRSQHWTTTRSGAAAESVQLDALGADVGWAAPAQPGDEVPDAVFPLFGDPTSSDVLVDGVQVPSAIVSIYLNFHSGFGMHDGAVGAGGGMSEVDTGSWVNAYDSESTLLGSSSSFDPYDPNPNKTVATVTVAPTNAPRLIFIPGPSVAMAVSQRPMQKPSFDPETIKKAIGDCISAMYPHYQLVDFTATQEPIGAKGDKDDRFNGTATIKDANTGSTGTIVSDPTPSKAILKELESTGRGLTRSDNPWWGYVAPDVNKLNARAPSQIVYPQLFGALPFLKTQVHELGGALGIITKMYYPNDYHLFNNRLEPGHGDNGRHLRTALADMSIKA